MSARQSRWPYSAVLAVAALAALGCGSPLPEPPVAPQPESAYVPVPFPPPPARPEYLPKRPSPTAVWVDGEWQWMRRRWTWVYGRWVEPPAGVSFARSSWRRDSSGQLHYAPGRWRDSDGAVVAEPRPLALANADEGDVIEDVGIVEDVGPNVVAGARAQWLGPAPAPCRNPPDVADPAAPRPLEEGPRRGPQGPPRETADDCGAVAE
jgi:hypothetical protein